MSRIGLALTGGLAPAETVECIVLAESLGYESAWIPIVSPRAGGPDSKGRVMEAIRACAPAGFS